MPERLSRATLAACAVLAAAAFGGAYALAHDGPAKSAPAPASPRAIQLADEPVGTLRHVSPLPALIVPRPKPAQRPSQPVVTVPVQALPTPATAPASTPAPAASPQSAPAPKPRRPAPAKPPVTFDDSG